VLTRAHAVAALLTAAVVVAAFAIVLPRLADLGDVWRLVRHLHPLALLGLAALALLDLCPYAWQSMASLPGLSFRRAFVVTQASTAVANVVPAGGGVGVGVTYAMYGGYGFASPAVAVSVATTGIANFAVKFAMPAVAALVLVVSGDAPSWAWQAAWIGLVLLTLCGVAAYALARGSAAARVERLARRVARLRRRDPDAAARVTAAWLASLRGDAAALRGRRGEAVAAIAVASHLGLYALFAGCLAAVGAGVAVAASFAVFAVVRLGLAVPVTPGGVGVAEAGYAAALVAAGATAEGAVAAVLLFRAASYLLPVPVGAACLVAWRRRATRRGTARVTRPA
jgi:uncharacterized protein (TIRG00374 family)